MRILILGGAGAMAQATEQDLLTLDADETSELVLADFDEKRLQERVDELKDPKVSSAVVHIDDHQALVKLMKGFDIVINEALAPTTLKVLNAALDAQVSLVTLATLDQAAAAPGAPLDDIGLPTEGFKAEIDRKFTEAGLTAVLGLGSGPGTSNVMGSYIADKFDTVESMEFSYSYAHLGGSKGFFPFDPRGMVAQHSMSPIIFRNGEFIRVPPRFERGITVYPDPIGVRETFYISHSEAFFCARNYRNKGLKNAGTKAGWDPVFIEKLAFLENLGLLDMQPRKIGDISISPLEMLVSGLKYDMNVRPQDYGCFRIVALGMKDGQKVEYTGDVFTGPYKNFNGTQHRTGIPPAVVARMLGRGEITRKGAFSPDVGVDHRIYFRELERREIRFCYTSRYFA
jgi:saccharopine dehydrogenase-like NADP-dependent oxidoreductase